MGLSTSLLVVAVLAALVPLAVIGPQPPRRLRDFEKGLVSGVAVALAGGIAVHVIHHLNIFGALHLLYLLGVVTLPMILGGWFLLSLRSPGPRRIDSIFGMWAVLVAMLGVYATHIEPNWLAVDEAIVTADIVNPIRIGVLADLQTPGVGDHELEAVAQILARDPDIVLVPGDLYQGDAETITAARSDFVDLLRTLVENTELVAVVSGDSDWSIPLRPIVEEAGAIFIDDTILAFPLKGTEIRLAGVRVLADGPGRANTLAALSEPTDGLSLLLAHRPDVVYDLPGDADIDLVIAGHTHGGQISLPLFGPPVTFSSIPRDLAAGGLGLVENVPLYVSAGVGLERLEAPQVRFGARPEVGIIDIVPR